jgi:hypothetical protein
MWGIGWPMLSKNCFMSLFVQPPSSSTMAIVPPPAKPVGHW